MFGRKVRSRWSHMIIMSFSDLATRKTVISVGASRYVVDGI